MLPEQRCLECCVEQSLQVCAMLLQSEENADIARHVEELGACSQERSHVVEEECMSVVACVCKPCNTVSGSIVAALWSRES